MELPVNIQPLVDGDWILYMACNAIEYPLMKEWKMVRDQCLEEGLVPPPEPDPSFGSTIEVLENKLKEINLELKTEVPPILFFTGENNFRKELAVTKTYKGNRSHEKPFHYENLKTYIEARYDTRQEDNLEADDLMAIWQTNMEMYDYPTGRSSCIVTVDKDLRQVKGWHYSPEGYNYGSFGPTYVTDDNSYLEPKNPEKISKGLVGTGWKFFYSQLLVGDNVDNIPGLPLCGPVAAYQLLKDTTTEGEAFELVRDAYRDKCIMADDYLLEQARLLWMIRGYDNDGAILHWSPPVLGEADENN